ncbi:MAG: TlpA family protein disulfide reductase [Flavobacteriaceae bacterium]|nr:TlpA family protein disulfide reductase [Flavobacteriaceae bacterium]
MKNLLLFTFSLISIISMSQGLLPTSDIKYMDGKITNIEKLAKKNDLVVISLWATWCAPCKNELDAINEVYIDWVEETGVKLYAVSVDDSRTINRVKPLVNGRNWGFTVLLDTNNELRRELNSPSIPLTILIKNGKIVYRHSGYTPGAEYDLYEKIKKYK